MARGHYITAAAAFTAGIVTQLTLAGAPEVSARPLEQKATASLTLGAAAESQFETFLANQACSAIEAEASLLAGECTSGDIGRVWLHRVITETGTDWRMVAEATFAGNWSKAP